ncbi:hypothetical protein HN51_047640 [Arachis hypogaea]
MPQIREIVLKKECDDVDAIHKLVKVDYFGGGKDDSSDKCYVPEYKHNLVKNAEPLISMEPLKPWITLKRNLKNIRYLSSMVDISFKRRYVYVDVGARSYGSTIGSWFRKQYPKQNKTFHVYAMAFFFRPAGGYSSNDEADASNDDRVELDKSNILLMGPT